MNESLIVIPGQIRHGAIVLFRKLGKVEQWVLSAHMLVTASRVAETSRRTPSKSLFR